jgi:ketosteroid isomerase-like protein
MSQENVAVVRRAYDAFTQGDLNALMSVFDEQIEWITPGPAALPTAGRRQGRDQVGQFFATVSEMYEFERFAPETFMADGDKVIVLGEDTVVVKATGQRITEAWAHAFTVNNGSIIRFQEYLDTAALVAELRASAATA